MLKLTSIINLLLMFLEKYAFSSIQNQIMSKVVVVGVAAIVGGVEGGGGGALIGWCAGG